MTARTCQDSVFLVIENTLIPYKYLVMVRHRQGMGEKCLVAAWTAEDALVQIEVQYEIRGNKKPDYFISSIEPYVPVIANAD